MSEFDSFITSIRIIRDVTFFFIKSEIIKIIMCYKMQLH